MTADVRELYARVTWHNAKCTKPGCDVVEITDYVPPEDFRCKRHPMLRLVSETRIRVRQ